VRKSPGLLPLGARELKGGATARPPDLGCHSPRLHPRAGPMRVVGNRRIAGQPRSDERRRPMCMNSWVRPPRTCERHKADCQPRSGGRRQRARPTRRRDPVGYRRRMGRVRRQEWQDHSGERPQSSAFVFSASKANRSRPMRIDRSLSNFDAVSDAHRQSNPGNRCDSGLTNDRRCRNQRPRLNGGA